MSSILSLATPLIILFIAFSIEFICVFFRCLFTDHTLKEYFSEKKAFFNTNFGGSPFWSKIILLLIVSAIAFGGFCLLWPFFFTNKNIGSFFEKDEYTQAYYAEIGNPIDSSFIPCVISIHKNYDEYTVESVRLPFGKPSSLYLDSIYEPADDANELEYDGYYESSVNYYLIEKMNSAHNADLKAYEETMKKTEYDILASSESDKFHLSMRCPHAKEIKEENKIYFNSADMAYLFGYDICSWCEDHASELY